MRTHEMNDFEQQQQAYDLHIDQAKRLIALGESLEQLSKNRHYKAVFDNFLFDEEVKRMVFARTNPALNQEHKAALEFDLNAIAGIRHKLFTLAQTCEYAKSALDRYEAEKEAAIHEWEEAE